MDAWLGGKAKKAPAAAAAAPSSPNIDEKSPTKASKVEDEKAVKKRKMVIDDDDEAEFDGDDNKNKKDADSKEFAKTNKSPAKAPVTSPLSAKKKSPSPAKPVAKPVAAASSSSSSSSSFSSSSSVPAGIVPTSSKAVEAKMAAAIQEGEDNSKITSTDSADIPKDVADIITWEAGEKVPYQAVCNCFEAVASVSGRLDKEAAFARLFRAVILTSPKELETIVYLISNTVAPAYEGLELGIGESLLVKAICESTGRTTKAVVEAYVNMDDVVCLRTITLYWFCNIQYLVVHWEALVCFYLAS